MVSSVSMAEVIDADTAVLNIPEMIREDEYGYRTVIEGKSVSPLTTLPLEEGFKISKSSGAISVTLKRFADGSYTCTCPAWKYSTERHKSRKTCPHLADVLGQAYEQERLAIAKESDSNVWQTSKTRRAPSDSAQVRQARAKSMLDKHYRDLSRSQSSASASIAPSSPKLDAVSSSSLKKRPVTEQPRAQMENRFRDAAGGESDTEEEESSLPSSSIVTTQKPTSGRSPQAEIPTKPNVHRLSHDDSDDTLSASKKSRRRHKAMDEQDEKVSLLLAKPWPLDADPSKPRSKAMDPTSWWISEKLDGVRAFWDGHRLYSRQKIEWNAPAWWKARLPKDMTLDGELWMARGTFDQTSQICRSTVRLGRLRTFKHYLQRDPMERQWLREQAGGKQASQERIRGLKQARIALDVWQDIKDYTACATPRLYSWKKIKRVKLEFKKAKSDKLGHKSRLLLAQSFVSALAGAVNAADCALTFPQKDFARRRKVIRRCAGCGKRLVDKKKSRCLSDLGVPADACKVARAHTDHVPLTASSLVSNSEPPCSRLRTNDTTSTMRSNAPFAHVCLRKTKNSNEWNRIKFMIFDAPSMGSLPVEDRWAELERRFGTTGDADIDDLEGPQIKLVRHVSCRSKDHLLELMEQVEAKGGEGLMLRKPQSKYEGRRGTTLYKLKSWYDAEAEVIGYADGTGRFQGHAGSLVARMECGTVFRVGTGMSDALRHNPPPLGTIINYRFFELSEDGYPRFPAFRGIARDKLHAKDAVVRPRAGLIRAETAKALLARQS